MSKPVQKKKRFLLLCILLGIFHVLLLFYYGSRKEGYHEDEYYSYWSSAGEAWLYPSSEPYWRSGYDFQFQFMVEPGEEFQFGAVIQNQAEDVHPPLYYLALNIVMSLFSGHMYKWFGILLNMLFSVITYCGILFFLYRLDDGKYREFYALLGGLVYAVAPSTVSNVMLTRMYSLSAMWTVLYACLFLLLIQSHGCSRKHFAGLTAMGALICYAAFLTHYFCLLIPFFLTLGFCVYTLLKRENIVRMLLYGVCMLAAIGLVVLTYPACIQHIFSGYRGTDAIHGLKSSLMDFLRMLLPVLNKNIFAGQLPLIATITALCFLVGILFLFRNRKNHPISDSTCCLVISVLSCIGSICLLSKVALYCGDATCRYFYPVIALTLPLIAYITGKTLVTLVNAIPSLPKENRYLRVILSLALCILVTEPYIAGHAQNHVLFLYEDESEKKAFSYENAEYPAVILYNTDYRYRTWFFADQLWPYQNLYFCSCDDMMSDTVDPRLEEAEKIIVYISGSEDVLKKMVEKYSKIDSYTLVDDKNGYFATFLLE